MDEALAEVNDLLLQVATPEQAELFQLSALDEYLRDSERDERRRREAIGAPDGETLEPFIPRRGDGLMLSASDIETYRMCPLKYKFARVFRIPQEPTINQRFGILLHQVLERFHQSEGGSLDHLMQLFEISWRRNGFGDSNDDLQFREKAVAALQTLLGGGPRRRTHGPSGSSARSRSSSGRTCCAAASTASTATPTAPTS